ncbi:MAG: DUF3105 domain-containing protein, partial [Micromonosporaceae bacterium]
MDELMSKKTKPEVDEDVDLDLDDVDLDDADLDADPDEADLDDAGDDDAKPRLSKKSDTAAKKATKSTSRRGAKSRSSQSAFVSGGKRPGGKSGGKSGGRGSGGRGGRGTFTPVRVASQRPWGTIALFGLVGVLFVGIVGYTFYQSWINDLTPKERAMRIDGVKDYTAKVGKAGDHKEGVLTYEQTPPVGGPHNATWQNCQGNVYDAPIAKEHAVHSMEHGTVWITYQPDLPKDQVEKLAERVRGKDYMMLSPFKGQPTKISVQAWGYQLQLDDAEDSRIDDFSGALRGEGPEKGAACSEGVTVTGDAPREVQPPQQQPQP